MAYYFHGMPRLQWPFDSPNKLAAFIVLLLPFVIVFVHELWRGDGRRRMARIGMAVGVLCATVGTVALVATYSRGGYVAFAVGLTALACVGHRKAAFVAGGLFAIVLKFLPHAAERAVALNAMQDMSIRNRLVLWKSVCEMCVDNPLLGIGRSVGEIYMAWYQPLERTQVYQTAVSDYLTLGARHGLPALLLCVTAIAFVVVGLFRRTRRMKSPFSSALAAGVLSYAVASVFSTFYTTPALCGTFVAALLIGGSSVAREGVGECVRTLRLAMGPALAVGLSILAVGFSSRSPDRLRYDYGRWDGVDCVTVKMGDAEVQGLMVYLFDNEGQTIEAEGRQTVRALVRSGWPVVSLGVASDEKGLASARAAVDGILKQCGSQIPIALVGQNCGGRFAFLMGLECPNVKKVATIGAYASWPFAMLSPADCGKAQNHPNVRIVNGEADWRTDVGQAWHLKSICERLDVNARVVVVPNADNRLGDVRSATLHDIADWIAAD